jgi:hypothetical protein
MDAQPEKFRQEAQCSAFPWLQQAPLTWAAPLKADSRVSKGYRPQARVEPATGTRPAKEEDGRRESTPLHGCLPDLLRETYENGR